MKHSLFTTALSLTLASSMLLAAPSVPAYAKKADKAPATTSKTAPQTAKITKTLEKKPVLDEAALKAIQEASSKLDPETRNSLNKLSDAIHLEDRAVYNELRDDEELSLSDIGMLWQAAVERSGTIRYAIEKLSRRDATGKPVANDAFSKRMLQSLVHLGGAAGAMWTGNPGSLIGANMVNDLMSGNPQDSALSKVTDADMVILAKEVEALQEDIVNKYYAYRHAKERLALSQEATSTIAKYYDHANDTQSADPSNAALQPLMQSIYESSRQDEQNAEQAVASARTSLALLVGPDAVAALEAPKEQPKSSIGADKPAS